jgi:hypothetical protein
VLVLKRHTAAPVPSNTDKLHSATHLGKLEASISVYLSFSSPSPNRMDTNIDLCYNATKVQKFLSLVMSCVKPLTVHIVRHSTSLYFLTIRHRITSYVTCLGLPHYSILFHKLQYYREKIFEHKTCVLRVYNFVRNIFSLKRIWRVKYMEVFMLNTR